MYRRRLTSEAKIILIIIAVLFAIIVFPALFAAKKDSSQSHEPGNETSSPGGINFNIQRSESINVYVGGKIEKMNLEDYVTGVVAAEMPASYEPEALKAQAVASRTYTIYLKTHGGCGDYPGADVSADSNSCQAYISVQQMAKRWGDNKDANYKKIRAAIDSTAGQIIYYNGDVIEALYFACSGGRTEDCASVFSQSLPYLKSVPSGGEEGFSNYYGKVTVTADEFIKDMEKYSKSIVIDKNNIAGAIRDIVRTGSNRVESIKIGNETFTGREIRSIFSLNSTNFTVKVTDEVTFETLGFGHGVGMSQDGADAMAKKGAGYMEILKHYYTGVTIK